MLRPTLSGLVKKRPASPSDSPVLPQGRPVSDCAKSELCFSPFQEWSVQVPPPLRMGVRSGVTTESLGVCQGPYFLAALNMYFCLFSPMRLQEVLLVDGRML